MNEASLMDKSGNSGDFKLQWDIKPPLKLSEFCQEVQMYNKLWNLWSDQQHSGFLRTVKQQIRDLETLDQLKLEANKFCNVVESFIQQRAWHLAIYSPDQQNAGYLA